MVMNKRSGFNFHLHQKLKNQLVSWSDDKELLSEADPINWNSLKKIKKKMEYLKKVMVDI